jgi:hypothetical protein
MNIYNGEYTNVEATGYMPLLRLNTTAGNAEQIRRIYPSKRGLHAPFIRKQVTACIVERCQEQ